MLHAVLQGDSQPGGKVFRDNLEIIFGVVREPRKIPYDPERWPPGEMMVTGGCSVAPELQRKATAIANVARVIAPVHTILSLPCGEPSSTLVWDVAHAFQVTLIKVECCGVTSASRRRKK
jgi:hypothetical protein